MQEIEPMVYISRMDYDRNSPGWWVRFQIQQKLFSHKMFYDHNYIDGKEEALHYAQEWRDWELKRLIDEYSFKPAWDGHKIPPFYEGNKRTNNKSKVIGVHRNECTYNRKIGKKYYPIHCVEWRATWIEYHRIKGSVKRIPTSKAFAIKKWGEEEAKNLAIQARTEALFIMKSKSNLELRNKYLKRNEEKK